MFYFLKQYIFWQLKKSILSEIFTHLFLFWNPNVCKTKWLQSWRWGGPKAWDWGPGGAVWPALCVTLHSRVILKRCCIPRGPFGPKQWRRAQITSAFRGVSSAYKERRGYSKLTGQELLHHLWEVASAHAHYASLQTLQKTLFFPGSIMLFLLLAGNDLRRHHHHHPPRAGAWPVFCLVLVLQSFALRWIFTGQRWSQGKERWTSAHAPSRTWDRNTRRRRCVRNKPKKKKEKAKGVKKKL